MSGFRVAVDLDTDEADYGSFNATVRVWWRRPSLRKLRDCAVRSSPVLRSLIVTYQRRHLWVGPLTAVRRAREYAKWSRARARGERPAWPLAGAKS